MMNAVINATMLARKSRKQKKKKEKEDAQAENQTDRALITP